MRRELMGTSVGRRASGDIPNVREAWDFGRATTALEMARHAAQDLLRQLDVRIAESRVRTCVGSNSAHLGGLMRGKGVSARYMEAQAQTQGCFATMRACQNAWDGPSDVGQPNDGFEPCAGAQSIQQRPSNDAWAVNSHLCC